MGSCAQFPLLLCVKLRVSDREELDRQSSTKDDRHLSSLKISTKFWSIFRNKTKGRSKMRRWSLLKPEVQERKESQRRKAEREHVNREHARGHMIERLNSVNCLVPKNCKHYNSHSHNELGMKQWLFNTWIAQCWLNFNLYFLPYKNSPQSLSSSCVYIWRIL